MKKIIIRLSLLSLSSAFAITPVMSAQSKKQVKHTSQTLQEATDSIKNVLAEARKGDARAQNDVGLWYYTGRHVDCNYHEAMQWWARSARQDFAPAIGNMALCYQTGNGAERDSLKAIKLYQKSIEKGNKALFRNQEELAAKGDIFADMLLGSCYENGIGTEKNINTAARYYAAAATKGSAEAQLKTGVMLLNAKKPAEAAKFFKMGYERNEPVCTYYYGLLMNRGEGMPKDAREGADIMLKAAEAGQRQAMYEVAMCYFNGNGMMPNAEQGMKWMRRAAAEKAQNAAWILAGNYRQGVGTPVDYDRAMYWYAIAMERQAKRVARLVDDTIAGSPFVSYMRGVRLYNEKDFDAALKEFKAVDKAKVADGKVMTGAIYCNRDYAKRNLKKGMKLLTEASATSPQALFLLASLYEGGKDVTRDMEKAVDLMRKGADAGYAPAQCGLGDMYYEGRGVEKNLDLAVKYYLLAMEQGQISENSAKRLAECYRNGLGGLEASEKKAEEAAKAYVKPAYTSLLQLIK